MQACKWPHLLASHGWPESCSASPRSPDATGGSSPGALLRQPLYSPSCLTRRLKVVVMDQNVCLLHAVSR